MNFKPMLSPREDPLSYPDYFKKLQYPLLASPKLDGIRAIIKDGTAFSRTFKALPSGQVQDEFTLINHFDGEILEGNPSDTDVYNRTQSHVMSFDKTGDLSYHVFDWCHEDWLHRPFYERLEMARKMLPSTPSYKFVDHISIETEKELLEYEEYVLKQGYEGIMMRSPVGYYKTGRGTFKEGLIYKLKRFEDVECPIWDFIEKQINTSPQERDELGYAKRSDKKDFKESAGMVGAFVVSFEEQELIVAPGAFSHDELITMWENQELYRGAPLKFRFMRHGMKDKPRFPRAVGLRTRGT